MLLTTVGIRIHILGDDVSKLLVIDLENTPVEFISDNRTGLLPSVPDVVVMGSIGGVNISPETRDSFQVIGKIIKPYLILGFPYALKISEENYTVDLILGYNSVEISETEEIEQNASIV